MQMTKQLSIGEVARRSGLAPSALRHYERVGLLASHRTSGDRRRYERSVLRRLAVIRAGRAVGLSLAEIRASFESIGLHGAPTRDQWTSISASWRPALDRQIKRLEEVRDRLDDCMGCGCLSWQRCTLHSSALLDQGHRLDSQRAFDPSTSRTVNSAPAPSAHCSCA